MPPPPPEPERVTADLSYYQPRHQASARAWTRHLRSCAACKWASSALGEPCTPGLELSDTTAALEDVVRGLRALLTTP